MSEELGDYSSLQQLCVCVGDNQISTLYLSSSLFIFVLHLSLFRVREKKSAYPHIYNWPDHVGCLPSVTECFVCVFIWKTCLRCRTLTFLVLEVLLL